jgi:hypothetical protein
MAKLTQTAAHPRESGDPLRRCWKIRAVAWTIESWIPAFAGMSGFRGRETTLFDPPLTAAMSPTHG